MPLYREGDTVGPWRLVEYINAGGNAEVWRATRLPDDVVALKILKSVRAQSEPYRRFRDEVSAVRQLGDVQGILPVITASLPDRPSRRHPAWLAMPLAKPLRDAVAEASLETIVDAVGAVAETLATLAERGIFHRDLKPENLYRYADGWAVGDFGLVEFPEKQALTVANRKLGPIAYLAPEMLTDAASAEPGPADVYALAKTLWVLAAGQTYPLPGELRRDRAGARGSDVVAHQRSHFLDRLLERATRDAPEARPSMRAMANELRAWLETPSSPQPLPDLSTLADRVASTLGPLLRQEERILEYRRLAGQEFTTLVDAIRRLQAEVLTPIGLRGQLPSRTQNVVLGGLLPRTRLTTRDGGGVVAQHYNTLRVRVGSGATLWMAIGIEAFEDGTMDLAAGHAVGISNRNIYERPLGSPTFVWSFYRTVEIGSAEHSVATSQLLAGLEQKLLAAVDAFLELERSR